MVGFIDENCPSESPGSQKHPLLIRGKKKERETHEKRLLELELNVFKDK